MLRALLIAGAALVGAQVATRFSVAILLGAGILGLMGIAFAIQHYAIALNSLIFLNIALISVSIYAFPLPGGFDLQLNRLPVLIAIPFWLMPHLLPPSRPLRLRFSWAFVWYGLFATYALLSIILLSDNTRTAISQMAALLFRGVLFMWLPQVIVSRRQLSLASKALITGGLVIIAFAVFQYTAWFTGWNREGFRFVIPLSDVLGMKEHTAFSGRIGPLFRLVLPFGSSSYLGPCIAALLLVAIGLWLCRAKHRGWKAVFLAGFCLVMFALLLGTYSRGAWIGFVVGLLTMLIFQNRLLLKRRVWYAVLATITVLAILIPLLLPFAGTILTRFNPMMTQGTNRAHLDLLLDALALFSSNPVIGIGWANYEAITGVLHAHNTYATILAEAGMMGLILWLLICGAIVHHGIRALRTSPPESFLRYWNLGLLAAFMSILVDALFQAPAYFGFPWVIAGLIVASHYVTTKEVEQSWRTDEATI